jgi:nitroreductase
MLAAQSYGLGTCAQYQVVAYPEELRKILNIPESKLIICGLSIGYPEMEVPQNKFRSLREPLEALAVWHGFDNSSS